MRTPTTTAPSLARLALALLLATPGATSLSGCSGGRAAARAGPTAPKWFQSPPKGARSLYFVGSAAGAADEQTARDLAVQKALSELTVYCGANITSDFSSEEVERNGQLTQTVSLTVDIAGDEMTIREAVVKETKSGAASDGTWDAFALVEWPKAQYEAVLASQRQRAERALALYLEAEQAAGGMQIALAETKLRESKQILGPMKAQVPLRHAKYTNSALLWDAVQAMKTRLADIVAKRRRVLHVAVLCHQNGKPAACPSHRVGAVKQSVSRGGLEVSADRVEPRVAEEIVSSSSPRGDASLRSAGFVLAVRYDGKLTAQEDGFTFVHCGARGVVYDTDAHRIVQVHEVKPRKGGHVHFEGALEKSCGKAEEDMVAWLGETLPKLK